MTDRFYVTTAIPYVNARPHVGFALELVQGDVLARYHRLTGGLVRFQTGTDENAMKNVLAARALGVETQALVDQNSGLFRELGRVLDVSADSFLRTTEERHRRGVAAFWRQLRADDIYRRRYEGLYCSDCEDFYLPRDAADGGCPEHGTPLTPIAEENYFFRLSAYDEPIRRLFEEGRLRVTPENRRNEILAFLRRGLQDISISRAAARAEGWGIPVPGDPSQVIYVWVDALVNYISGLGYGSGDAWRDVWHENVVKVHVIGKNVWKFHAVYWPALLLSAGLPLPDELVVHGFLTVEGRKISKSQGPGPDPFACVEAVGADALRYYLLRGVSAHEDGDFSLARVKELYNTDLANGLGNLISRLTALCARVGFNGFDCTSRPAAPSGYHEAVAARRFDEALKTVWDLITRLNQDIERVRPWSRRAPETRWGLDLHLTGWLRDLRRIAYWLAPFLPGANARILGCLTRRPIAAGSRLFPRLET